ncbi:hypothetical protein HY992_03410 [Candidatus Micrarchaeota archaeon]|nr:hypothetical protein [Candidatus Micrarchaeota archaeon]
MQKYLVNSTYCIYMLDIGQLYFDESVETIRDVAEEVLHEKGVVVAASIVPIKKAVVQGKTELLSDADLALLRTAKASDRVLVTDDQKLGVVACRNGVRRLDTPHFIHRLVIEGKWPEEKAVDALGRLKAAYNRVHVVDKVMHDIRNWR